MLGRSSQQGALSSSYGTSPSSPTILRRLGPRVSCSEVLHGDYCRRKGSPVVSFGGVWLRDELIGGGPPVCGVAVTLIGSMVSWRRTSDSLDCSACRPRFSAPLEVFRGEHRSAACTRLSAFRMYAIVEQGCAGNEQKCTRS